MKVHPEFSRKIVGKLGIIFGFKCNFSCAHCLTYRENSKKITERELNVVADAIDQYRVRNIHFTGGEPTLYLKEMCSLLDRIRDNRQATVRITTNGHFASTKTAARKLLSSIPRLKYVQLSYDKFHKKFLPFANLRNALAVCRELGVNFCCNLTIQSPMDLILLSELRRAGEFPVLVQKVSAIGEAKRNGLAYMPPAFDKNLLSRRCPNRNNLVYIYGRGFSVCCSSLLFNGRYRWLCDKSPETYLKSDFHKFISNNTFKKIAEKLSVPISELRPEHSSPCGLCEKLFVTRFGKPGAGAFPAITK